MNLRLQQIAQILNTNMSLINLDNLTAEFPEDKEAIKRIANLLERSVASKKKATFSINRIVDVAGSISQYSLAHVLLQFEKEGVIKKVIRVETSDGTQIRDFASVTEVPNTIHDWRNDIEMTIAPENLHIYYKINK